jgi:hypothetical protein
MVIRSFSVPDSAAAGAIVAAVADGAATAFQLSEPYGIH